MPLHAGTMLFFDLGYPPGAVLENLAFFVRFLRSIIRLYAVYTYVRSILTCNIRFGGNPTGGRPAARPQVVLGGIVATK